MSTGFQKGETVTRTAHPTPSPQQERCHEERYQLHTGVLEPTRSGIVRVPGLAVRLARSSARTDVPGKSDGSVHYDHDRHRTAMRFDDPRGNLQPRAPVA